MPLRNLRILVLDNAEITALSVSAILSVKRARVLRCHSAAEALGYVRSWKPNVVLCDVELPDQDGYWFVRNMRLFNVEAGGNTPAIALSDYADEDHITRAIDAGFDKYIAKPFRSDALIEAITNLTTALKLIGEPA